MKPGRIIGSSRFAIKRLGALVGWVIIFGLIWPETNFGLAHCPWISFCKHIIRPNTTAGTISNLTLIVYSSANATVALALTKAYVINKFWSAISGSAMDQFNKCHFNQFPETHLVVPSDLHSSMFSNLFFKIIS